MNPGGRPALQPDPNRTEKTAFPYKGDAVFPEKERKRQPMGKFKPICEGDTEERRRELRLPITKPIRYMHHVAARYAPFLVTAYEILYVLEPSGTSVLEVTLDNGQKQKILSLYLEEMQHPDFEKKAAGGIQDEE